MSADPDRPAPEFDEPRDSTKRANAVVEEKGGLPDDNPFAEVVRDLRDDGQSWNEIHNELHAVDRLVDEAALEEKYELIPEWEVMVIVPDEQATSGERYETREVLAETAEKAEEMVEKKTVHRVVSKGTTQIGVEKVA